MANLILALRELFCGIIFKNPSSSFNISSFLSSPFNLESLLCVLYFTVDPSRVTSICENEHSNPLSNVRQLNGMLNLFSGNLSEKDALTGKKIQNTQGKQLLFLKYAML